MQYPFSNPYFVTSNTQTTDNMGHAYRTPSPIREPYISSSNVNSPKASPEPYTNHPCKYTSHELCTPEKKRMSVHWHGLPSPETPTFCGDTSDTRDTPSADSAHEKSISQASLHRTEGAVDTILETAEDSGIPLPPPNPLSAVADTEDVDDVKITIPQEPESAIKSDEIAARKLEALLNPTKTRQSARLRMQPKPTYTIQVPDSDAKSAKRPSPPPVAQPEFSTAPFKADPVPFDGLPSVHSLSWQLQYPPGGSTHPSYPYPAMDPRLLFHHTFVPIIGGLPDVKLVPKLVLPMGWKQISWSGLLPIVFDPYRQAFKLTPCGPMPLTCEELHQQGLHKYVPGGELHPEYGMLPDMLKLSDGSDATVFDFDGVDWTLPWEGQVDFHAPSRIMDHHYGSDEISSPTASNTLIPMITYPWSEARDCPDKVFDLSDGWRWLATKETILFADFIPTPEKTWHRSGAFRASRKLKSPIPELMMLAIQSTPTTPDIELNPLLQNQDPAKGKNQFCPYKSVATPCTVDITLLGDTEFTIMELLSYFPQHYCWGHAAERLAKAGVTPTVIRDAIIMTRGLQGDEIVMACSIGTAATAARKRDCTKVDKVEEMDIDEVGRDSPAPKSTPTSESTVVDISAAYTAEEWRYDVWEKIDYPLLALAHGLQSLPTVPDAGPLTALILWCREKGRHQVLLSQVPALLKEAEIEPLIEPGEHGCPDREVAGRYSEALKKDRLRVVRDAGINKRALDSSVGDNQGKRRKMG